MIHEKETSKIISPKAPSGERHPPIETYEGGCSVPSGLRDWAMVAPLSSAVQSLGHARAALQPGHSPSHLPQKNTN